VARALLVWLVMLGAAFHLAALPFAGVALWFLGGAVGEGLFSAAGTGALVQALVFAAGTGFSLFLGAVLWALAALLHRPAG
jgi:hypothetical protein